MLPNNNLLYQFGVCLDFKLQKYNAKPSFTAPSSTSLACGNLTCKKDVTRCYAALVFYGQQFVEEEKGRNSKAILAADACVTHGFLRFGTCPLIHPNYFSVMIFVSVTELTLTPTLTVILTLNRPKNISGELTDKYPHILFDLYTNFFIRF